LILQVKKCVVMAILGNSDMMLRIEVAMMDQGVSFSSYASNQMWTNLFNSRL